MAIYVLSLRTFRIEFIIPVSDSEITALTWNPFNENTLASACEDKTLDIWDICEQHSKMQVLFPASVTMMHWSHCSESLVFVLLDSGEVHLLDVGQRKVSFVADFGKCNPSVLCCNPKSV